MVTTVEVLQIELARTNQAIINYNEGGNQVPAHVITRKAELEIALNGGSGGGGSTNVLAQNFTVSVLPASFTLLYPPVVVLQCTVNGIDLSPVEYSVLGSTVTLNYPPVQIGDAISIIYTY